MPVIRVDDEVYEALKRRAIQIGLVFGSPNDVLRQDYLQPAKEQDVSATSSPRYVDIRLSRKSALVYKLIPVRKAIRASRSVGVKSAMSLKRDTSPN